MHLAVWQLFNTNCSFCGVSQADFQSLGVFKEHVQKHEKDNGITCKTCKKLCLTKRVRYDHMGQVHGESVKCECCDK